MKMVSIGVFVCLSFCVWQECLADKNWMTGIRDNGNGFFLSAPDQAFHLSLLGYGQFLGATYFDDYHLLQARPDVPVGFSLRRARFDFIASVHRNYEFLMEVGTPTLNYPGNTGFGIVEARITAPIAGSALRFRIGKFVVPFSYENSISSRRLDTIERSSILNSVFASSMLDSQIGLMLFGQFAYGSVNYYFVAVNGNGGDFDNNGFKEFQIKLVFQPHQAVNFAFAYDTNFEPGLNVSLLDHAFTTYVTGQFPDRRHGGNFSLNVDVEKFTLRMEGIAFFFPGDDSSAGNIELLAGGHLHLGFFLSGNKNKGFEAILRWEASRMDLEGRRQYYDLHSLVLGWNWYFNSNVRYQMNYIAEMPSQPTGLGVYTTAKIKHIFLNQLEVKF